MHPLTKLLMKYPMFYQDEFDGVIRDYLKGRAEWLKGQCFLIYSGKYDTVVAESKHIDTAFELDEKCEPEYCRCDKPRTDVCNICSKLVKPQAPILPSKMTEEVFRLDGNHAKMRDKLNQIIDYLNSKEAREGER